MAGMALGRCFVASRIFLMFLLLLRDLVITGLFLGLDNRSLQLAGDYDWFLSFRNGKRLEMCGRVGGFGRHFDTRGCGGFQRTRFARSRVLYYSNGYATFNYELLRLCGDIIPTPGPTNENCCPVCNRSVAKNHRAVSCDSCTRWCHIKWGGISVKQYKEFDARQSFSWVCPPCLDILQQLPFANVSLVDSSLSSENSFSSGDDTIFLPGYQKLALEHAKNFKIGHINANSIGGLKFEEIRHWLELNYFDLLVITETKLNSSFPDSQFQVHGFRLLRNDRNRCGGGVAMFIRSNIPFMRAKRLESFIDIECVAVRLKLSNSWTTFVGLYRPPSLAKSTWNLEMCNLFETVRPGSNVELYMCRI